MDENEELNSYEEMLRGNLGSPDSSTNSFEFKIRNKKINFDFDLSHFIFDKDIRESLKKKFSLFFNDKTQISLYFENCLFLKEVFSYRNLEYNNTFAGCTFDQLIKIPNISVGGKVRFRDCVLNELNFGNTVFNDLVDFWKCEFHKFVIFHKTDFLGTTTFAASIFKEDVLFTYSLIQKNIIFRGTCFDRGLDLATAIIPGVLEVFNMTLGNFPAVYIYIKNRDEAEVKYDNLVCTEGKIPVRNKRETFRILKHTYISQSNIYESLEYKKLEKETLREELRGMQSESFLNRCIKQIKSWYRKVKAWALSKKWFDSLAKNATKWPDRFNLWLNFISNNHGKSYIRAALFTISCGWIPYYLSLLNTDRFFFTWNPANWEFSQGLKYFIMFLLPTHSFDYLGDEVVLYTAFYVFDFIGRIIVGYGIYQFIQAFRKFR